VTQGVTPPIPARIRKQLKALLLLEIVIAPSAFTGTAIALSSPTTGRETHSFRHIDRARLSVPLAGMMKQTEKAQDDD